MRRHDNQQRREHLYFFCTVLEGEEYKSFKCVTCFLNGSFSLNSPNKPFAFYNLTDKGAVSGSKFAALFFVTWGNFIFKTGFQLQSFRIWHLKQHTQTTHASPYFGHLWSPKAVWSRLAARGIEKRVSVWASAAARLDEGIRDRVWFPPRLPLLQFTDLHAVLLTHTSLSPSKYANCTLSQVPP